MQTNDNEEFDDGDQNDHTEIQVELNEEHMEGLEHGSGTTFEFNSESGHTLAVYVTRADVELDKEWLLNGAENDSGQEDPFPWRVVAGLALTALGSMQVAGPFVDIAPMWTGGLIALVGMIYTVDQMEIGGENGSAADV